MIELRHNKERENIAFSIADKGCALTSMAMVMNRYGSKALPDEWNKFLTVSGGYTSGGDVRWEVPEYIGLVNRDTPQRSKDDSTPLDNSLMDTYVDKCMPVIVKVKNWKQKADKTWTWNYHWVVVTGKSGSSYSIKDPGYADRNSLADHKYNNEIYAMQFYKKKGGCQ